MSSKRIKRKQKKPQRSINEVSYYSPGKKKKAKDKGAVKAVKKKSEVYHCRKIPLWEETIYMENT